MTIHGTPRSSGPRMGRHGTPGLPAQEWPGTERQDFRPKNGPARNARGPDGSIHARFSAPSSMSFGPASSGKRFQENSAAQAASMRISRSGPKLAFSSGFGRRGLPSTMKWRALRGDGRASTGARAGLHSPPRPWTPIRPTGGKRGTKRHVPVDGHGLPLSIVVTGANRHDVTQVENVLASRVRRPRGRRRQNLCADAGYDSEEAWAGRRRHGYVPHVRSRGEEKKELAAGKKARRWIVEVAHSWGNRFRKILVRFEKRKSSFEGLLQLAATIIVFRKRGIIYG